MTIGDFLSLSMFDGYSVRECFDLNQMRNRQTSANIVEDYRRVRNSIDEFDQIIIDTNLKEVTLLLHNK